MTSEFDDFMAAGVAEAFGVIGTTAIRCGQVTAGCVVSPFVATRDQRDSGYFEDVTSTAELTRADFVALAIEDRSYVTISARKLQVMKIEDDPHDPCIRLFLKPARSG